MNIDPLDEDMRRDLETLAGTGDWLVTDPKDLAALGRSEERNRRAGYMSPMVTRTTVTPRSTR